MHTIQHSAIYKINNTYYLVFILLYLVPPNKICTLFLFSSLRKDRSAIRVLVLLCPPYWKVIIKRLSLCRQYGVNSHWLSWHISCSLILHPPTPNSYFPPYFCVVFRWWMLIPFWVGEILFISWGVDFGK